MSILLIIGIFFVTYFFAWYAWFHIKRRRLYFLAKQFDGPSTLPIIGNSLKCLISLKDMPDVLLKGSSFYSSPLRFWVGPYLVIYIYNPEDVKTVLNSPHSLEKPPYYIKLLEPLTGRGLVVAPVQEWKRHRKLMAPIFNQKVLQSFFEIFNRHSEVLVNTLKTTEGKKSFDVYNHLVKYSMDTVLETLLSFDVENGLNNADVVANWMKDILKTLILKATNIWYFSDYIFNMTSMGKKALKSKQAFNKYMNLLIEKWEANSISTNIQPVPDEVNTDLSKPKKLVEHLASISDGSGKFTTEELKAEVNTIVVAGTETTSTLLGFLLIVLGIHQDVQQKVYQEIIDTLGNKKRLVNEDLKKLVYMEQVVKETLRIFPGQSGLARFNDKEIQLENHVIPANSTIIVGLLSLHRNSSIWPNPTKFDPNRFLPEEEAKRHPYSWVPFAAGPRNCIGIKFAWMSVKIVLASLMLNYKIDTIYKSIEDINLTMMLAIHPTNGFKLSISNRQSETTKIVENGACLNTINID